MGVSQEMNGITFFVLFQFYEFLDVILVAISVIFFLTIRLESQRRHVKKRSEDDFE